MIEIAKGIDMRTLAHKIAPNAQIAIGAWNFCEKRKNPNPNMRDGIAKYMFPEKAMMRFIKPLSFDCFTLWLMLKFLLVSLIKSANMTVSILEQSAIDKLVKRDFKKRSSLKIFTKLAPIPSTKIEIRGRINMIVKVDMINI